MKIEIHPKPVYVSMDAVPKCGKDCDILGEDDKCSLLQYFFNTNKYCMPEIIKDIEKYKHFIWEKREWQKESERHKEIFGKLLDYAGLDSDINKRRDWWNLFHGEEK